MLLLFFAFLMTDEWPWSHRELHVFRNVASFVFVLVTVASLLTSKESWFVWLMTLVLVGFATLFCVQNLAYS